MAINSTHFNHAIYPPAMEVITSDSNGENISAAELQAQCIAQISKMTPEEFIMGCTTSDSAACKATGWMVAAEGHAGKYHILHRNGHLGWASRAEAVKDKASFLFTAEEAAHRELPKGKFWISYEEVLAETPIFLASIGAKGELINLGTYFAAEDNDEHNIGAILDGHYVNLMVAIQNAGHPSASTFTLGDWKTSLQIDQDTMHEWFKENRDEFANRASGINWPATPAP